MLNPNDIKSVQTIEKLGFRRILGNNNKWETQDGRFEFHYLKELREWRILDYGEKDSLGDRCSELDSEQRFRGTIWNRPELRTLLNQLGIQ